MGFMRLAKRCSLLAHALSTAHVPAKKHFFQHNFDMNPDWKQHAQNVDCQTIGTTRPRSTIIFWYAKKINIRGPLTPSHGPSTIQNCFHIPVVPHKAVAEVSEEETYRRGWLLRITDGRANPLVFVGVVAMVAVVTSPTTAGCSVACCSCSRSCSVVEL